jgi:hypothetical protein
VWQNHHFSTFSAAVTTNVIRLRPPLVITKDTYAQATIWKKPTEKKHFLKVQGVQKMYFLVLNHHLSILSTTVTTNVIRLRPPLVITKDTYAQATIWKETTEKKHFLKVQGVQKMCFFGAKSSFEHIECYCDYQHHPLASPFNHNQGHICPSNRMERNHWKNTFLKRTGCPKHDCFLAKSSF